MMLEYGHEMDLASWPSTLLCLGFSAALAASASSWARIVEWRI